MTASRFGRRRGVARPRPAAERPTPRANPAASETPAPDESSPEVVLEEPLSAEEVDDAGRAPEAIEEGERDEQVEADDGEAGEAARPPSTRSLPAENNALVPADNLQRYLSEVRRYPLLSADEEHDLAVRWKEEGDRAAAMRLITSNLRLVVMIARQYQQAFRNLLDLVQEGNIGLLEAVKNFDPYRGVRFPSYAVWWIRAYIIRYVMNNWRLVKLGTTQAQRKLFFNLQREKDRLEREGFRPDPKLIADRLSVKKEEVIEMEQRLSGRDVSVDQPIGEESDTSMLDFLPDRREEPEARAADAEYRQIIADKIREFGERLHDKEKVIFNLRMIAEEPLTLQEIGERYQISRERVRQIEERIRKRLRTFLVSEIPDLGDVEVRMNLTSSS